MALERSSIEYPIYSPCIDSTVIKSGFIDPDSVDPVIRPVSTGGVIKATLTKEHDTEIKSRFFDKTAPAADKASQENGEQEPFSVKGNEMLDDAARTADQIIEQARREAVRIREDAEQMAQLAIEDSVLKAQEQYEAVHESARQEGYDAGYKEASEAVKNETAAKLAELGAIIASLKDKQVKMLSRYENDLAELSVEVARRIIKREVGSDKKILADMVREVVEDNRRENWVRVTVSENTPPLELTVDDEVLDLITSLGPNVTAAISRDVKEGLCLVETPGGSINVALDTQLKNIRKIIRENHTHRS